MKAVQGFASVCLAVGAVIAAGVLVALTILLVAAVLSFPGVVLFFAWNASLPALLGWSPVTFWQAIGIMWVTYLAAGVIRRMRS